MGEVGRHTIPEPDIKAIRNKLNMSQREFAETFGFTIHSIHNWEQGKRRPEGPARILLAVIAKEPQMVKDVLEERAVV